MQAMVFQSRDAGALAAAAAEDLGGVPRKARAQGFEQGLLDGPAPQGFAGSPPCGESCRDFAGRKGPGAGRRAVQGFGVQAENEVCGV